MSLTYDDLDAKTRALMLDELELDVAASNVFFSPRLNDSGRAAWTTMLRASMNSGSDADLERNVRTGPYLRDTETVVRNGRSFDRRVPVNAAALLAEGEFNRYYLRAVCRRAIEEGKSVEIYRGRPSSNPRPESEAKIGQRFDPQLLLSDLRKSVGVEPALGLPAVNSGLTGHIA